METWQEFLYKCKFLQINSVLQRYWYKIPVWRVHVYSTKYTTIKTPACKQWVLHYWTAYKGHLKTIWAQSVCSNFICRLNMKQLLAQHIPLIGHTWLPSLWELSYGFTESLIRGVVITLMFSCLYSFLTIVEAPYPVEHKAACRCHLSTNCRWLMMNVW